MDAVLYHAGVLAVASDDGHELRGTHAEAGVRAQLVTHAPQARHAVGRLVLALSFGKNACCIRIFPNFKFGFSLLLDSDFPEHSTQPRAPGLPREPAIITKQPVQRTILAIPFRMLARRQAIHDSIPRRENSGDMGQCGVCICGNAHLHQVRDDSTQRQPARLRGRPPTRACPSTRATG